MNIKEKAKQFAIKAHKGQLRKNEPDKAMIIHPISVAILLEEYGCDEFVIAAGYLHDVVEDTDYTLEDIKIEFGEDISTLVKGASEPDKTLSWKKRKEHTIKEVEDLPLRNKLIVCADKINNLEDLMLVIQKTGKRDFSKFNSSDADQCWYYTSIYQSLIKNADENMPMFRRLKDVIDKVFYEKKDIMLEEVFSDNTEYYFKLIELNAKKQELKRLSKMVTLTKPFVIEFTGTPRTGKTTILNNLYDFFKKGDFDIALIEELTTSQYYKEKMKPIFKDKPSGYINKTNIEETAKQLEEAVRNGGEIILVDRSLNDRSIWNLRQFNQGGFSKEEYEDITKKYDKMTRELIDILVIGYVDSATALKRDYLNSLALEERSFLTIENIDEYNEYLNLRMPEFTKDVAKVYKLDTKEYTKRDSSVLVASEIMDYMRDVYIKKIKEEYHGFK